MTILHSFLEAANKASEGIQKYLVSRQPSDLEEVRDLLAHQTTLLLNEIQNPSIQSTVLLLQDLNSTQLNDRILAENALTLYNASYTADGPIESGKFIRVLATDQAPDSVFLCRVTFQSNDVVVLAPVVDPS